MHFYIFALNINEMKAITEPNQGYSCEIKTPCFELLSEKEVALIKSSKTHILFKKGESLTKQGAFSAYILLVTDGFVKLTLELDHQKSYNFGIAKTGSFIGLSAVFNDAIFKYTSTAITDAEAFLIEKQSLLAVLSKNAPFTLKMMQNYCSQNALLMNALTSITSKQINGRIADTLQYLYHESNNDPTLFVNLARKDIADFAGVSTESAIKVLKSFEKEGIIKLEEKNISILQLDKLSEISRIG